jgi:hypothetical protein
MKIKCSIERTYDSEDYPESLDKGSFIELAKTLFIEDISKSNFKIQDEEA